MSNLPITDFTNTSIDHAQILTRRFAYFMCAVNLLLPFAVFISAEVMDQPYWRMFRSEGNFTAWFSSIQLLLISAVSYINYRLLIVASHPEQIPSPKHPKIWLAFTLGFIVFALDERFNYHEILRDELFAPAGIFTDTSFLIDGDIGLYLFYLIGLICTVFIYPELRNQPLSMKLYFAALVLTLPLIVIDSLNDDTLLHWPYWRFWDYVFEELGEVWAQLLFLLAFLNILYKRLELWHEQSITEQLYDIDQQ